MEGALLVVLTTVPDHASGIAIARTLVERRLVACAQLLPPMVSVFIWQDKLSTETEQLLLLKVPAEVYAMLEVALGDLHPYEVPEVVALEAVQVSEGYLGWAVAQTSTSALPPV
ncbi:MAG: divalent-cation tolerance protein CutA [Aphanocapsa lilacina HA4352-LM1]|nr:divalent-cation tolerance protein CutA [Aphanocapsa lilacina HA4352-LM1]